MSLADLERKASPEAIKLAVRLLESDIATQAWVDQVGYCLTQADTAALLDRSEQAVSKDSRLLRLNRSDGRPAYPAFQFDGRRQIPGTAEALQILAGTLEPATIAAWLTGAQPQFGGRRPIDMLAGAEHQDAIDLAKRLAERASR